MSLGSFPTKHLCILVTATLSLYLVYYLHQFSQVEYIHTENALFGTILDKFELCFM